MTTEYGVKSGIKRLIRAGYTGPPDIDALVPGWRDVLNDVSDSELSDAVMVYMKSEKTFFPKPGQLRAIALKARPTPLFSETEASYDPTEPCHICGATIRALSPSEQLNTHWDEITEKFRHYMPVNHDGAPRYGVLHDRRKHQAARVPAIGYWR